MAYGFLMLGAALALAGMVLHGFIGGRRYLDNVGKSDMEGLTKSLSLVAWHMFTILLFGTALALAVIAHQPELRLAAYPLIGIHLLGAALFLVLGLGKHKPLLRMPGAYLMGGTALLAWLGVS